MLSPTTVWYSNVESCTAIINSKQNWYFDSHLIWPQIHENIGLLQDHMKGYLVLRVNKHLHMCRTEGFPGIWAFYAKLKLG